MTKPGETPDPAPAGPSAEAPWSQEFLTRRVAFPAYCATKSFDAATRDFRAEAARIEQVCAGFTPDDFTRRMPVGDRFDGDPGSGDWSAAMVVEHVVLAGETIARITEMLAREQPGTWVFAAEALRPRGDRGLGVMQEFRNHVANYTTLATEELAESSSRRTHEHPLHGPLDLHRWHCFAAVHLRRHRRHLQAIRAALDDAARQSRQAAALLQGSTAFHPTP